MSATSGFCERCGNFLTQHCNGDRNTCMSILLNKIEALQKENNGWQERYYELDAGHSRLFKDFCKLQQENEQLRARVARMRGMLFELNEIAKDYAPWGNRYNGKGIGDIIQNADKLLDANTVQAYHNPADVEALRKAREALYAARFDVLTKETDELAREALAEIDKVIGGKEDV